MRTIFQRLGEECGIPTPNGYVSKPAWPAPAEGILFKWFPTYGINEKLPSIILVPIDTGRASVRAFR